MVSTEQLPASAVVDCCLLVFTPLQICAPLDNVTYGVDLGSTNAMGRSLSIQSLNSSNYRLILRHIHLHTFPHFHNLPIDEIYLRLLEQLMLGILLFITVDQVLST